MSNNILSINSIALDEYRDEMLWMVEQFFEVTESTSLSDIIEAFEFEMFVDNNLADKLHLSAQDLERLREIHIEVLNAVENYFIVCNVPEDILVEFISEFDKDSEGYYEFVLDLEENDDE